MALQTFPAAKEGLFVWVTRSLIATLVYLATDIRSDVKKLSEKVPVLESKIEGLQKQTDKMENKIYTSVLFKPAAKKEEPLNIDELFKSFSK